MGFLDFFGSNSIDRSVDEARKVPGALILDVRARDEYRQGHIPGAINVELNSIAKEIGRIAPSKDTPLYTYCLSGARSGKAVAALRGMGYTNVVNLGGINRYRGARETGERERGRDR